MSSSISENTAIHECAFKAYIKQTNTEVKFSCRMFVAWKNSANQPFCRTVNENVAVQNGVATFDEELTFQTFLLYDANTQLYLKKETSLSLMLVSVRKPGEEKLVGRVAINLADILNEGSFEDEIARELSFCSIKGSTLTFRIVSLWKKSTNMKRIEYDLNDFSIIANRLNQSESSHNEDFMTFRPKVDEEEESKKVTPEKEESRGGNITEKDEIENVSEFVKISKDDESETIKLENERVENMDKVDEMMPNIRIHNIESEESDTEEEKDTFIPKLLIKQTNEQYNEQYNDSKDKEVWLMNEKLGSMEKENEKLIEMINELNEVIADHKHKREATEKDLILLKEKALQKDQQIETIVSQLNIELKNKANENEKLKLSIQESDALIESLRKEIRIKETQNEENLLEIQTKLNVIANDGELIKGLREEIIQKDKVFEDKLKELEESEKIRLDFETEILEIRYELSELKTERVDLKNELAAKEEDIKKYKQDIKMSAELLIENDKKEKVTGNEYESLTVKIVCLEQELRAVEDELTRYESQRITLENEVKLLLGEKLELGDEIVRKEVEMEEYKKSVVLVEENLGVEIKNLKERVLLKDAEMNKYMMEVNEEKTNSFNIQQQLENELKAIKEQQTNLNEETQRKENTFKAQLESLNQNLHELTQEKTHLQQQLSEANIIIHNFEEQIQNKRNNKEIDLNNEKETELILKNEEIVLLRTKLAIEESRALEIEEKMNRFTDKEQKMRDNIIILEEESKRVYDIVTEKEEQEEALIAQIDKLKEENLMLIDELEFVGQQLHNYNQQNGVILKQASLTEVINNEQDKVEERPQPEEEFVGLINQANRRNSELEFQIAVIDKRHQEEISKLETGISVIQSKNEEEKVKVNMLEEEIIELKKEREELKLKIERECHGKEMGEEVIKLRETELRVEGEESKIEDSLKKQIETQIHLIEVQNHNNSALELQISQLTAHKSIIQTQLAEYELELQQLKNNLLSSNNQVAELSRKLEEKETKVENQETPKQFEHAQVEEKKSSELGNSYYEQPVSGKIELINACKNLQELIHERCEKDKLQTAIEFVLGKNVLLEEELNHTTEQRGTIQETARKLSMEFQIIKSKILKGKGSFQERTELITSLKPCELKVKELVEISERLSDFQLEGENF